MHLIQRIGDAVRAVDIALIYFCYGIPLTKVSLDRKYAITIHPIENTAIYGRLNFNSAYDKIFSNFSPR